MSRFAQIPAAPADPILGISEAFKADPRPQKVNLGVGVFIDEHGKTPTLKCIAEAARRLAASGGTKSYLPITGLPEYLSAAQSLCFGPALPAHIVSAQTPGGTGALRVAADFFKQHLSETRVWVSTPTWANHKGIFAGSGLEVAAYRYFDPAKNGIDREAFFADLSEIPAGDIVILHACCHNPTGADLSSADWEKVAEIADEKGWLPFIDFAYQGFGESLDGDARGVRILADKGLPIVVSQSFSKNFGLYQDRVGALHLLCSSADEAARVSSQVKIAIRVNYSNPPAHGAQLVAAVFQDESLTAQWKSELEGMRSRINGVRKDFVDALRAAEVSRDFSFLQEQRGMFSFTGLNREQAIRLREEFAIYMVESGRINVAGLNEKNLPTVVDALKKVIG